MARRRSGRVRINCTLTERLDGYRCSVKTPEGRRTIRVGTPASLRHAVDSPKAFDQAAHAALSFAADEGLDVESYADFTDTGWKITRK